VSPWVLRMRDRLRSGMRSCWVVPIPTGSYTTVLRRDEVADLDDPIGALVDFPSMMPLCIVVPIGPLRHRRC
jgi:hypothetical protein